MAFVISAVISCMDVDMLAVKNIVVIVKEKELTKVSSIMVD